MRSCGTVKFSIFAPMQAFGYYLALPFIYFLSILPFAVLRQVSNFTYFILYRVWGYRKQVILTNLRNSFPDKSEAEIQMIMRDFYRIFADTLIDTVKALTISHEQLRKHCSILNYEDVDAYIRRGKNVLLVLGHYGNWEYAGGSMAVHAPVPLKAAYKPLSNKYFNRLAVRSRTRLKIVLIPKRQLLKHLADRADEQTLLVLIADQSPNPKDHHWVRFLHQDTAVVSGMEKIARQYDYTVFYATIHPMNRGNYQIRFRLLTDDPNSLPPVKLTEMFMHELEQDILQYPAPYLWSHRRWKLKKPAGNPTVK